MEHVLGGLTLVFLIYFVFLPFVAFLVALSVYCFANVGRKMLANDEMFFMIWIILSVFPLYTAEDALTRMAVFLMWLPYTHVSAVRIIIGR